MMHRLFKHPLVVAATEHDVRDLMRLFLAWWSDRLPVREIKHRGERYLERYYVTTLFGYWRVYLHQFVGSDPDGLHSHPWRWGATIILAGWYLEQRRFGRRAVRWCGIVNGDTFHRVIVPDQSTTWSLFIHSPRVMNWGFLRRHATPAGPYTFYEEVGDAEPNALSGWWRHAPKGRDLRRAA